MQDKPALVLVALQKGFDEVDYWGIRNNPDAEDNARKLLQIWRAKGWPLFHLQHAPPDPASPLQQGKEGHEFKDEVTPEEGEHVITQNIKSQVGTAELRKELHEAGIKKIVFIGMSTDQCVSSTVRMAFHYGYDAYVVYDATATFGKPNPVISERMFSAELIHDTALASLKDEFASVVMTDELIRAINEN
ncbi:MAG: cysteine hydrolase [Azospira oryzae]|nr:cysteine hydrolase [Cytophaga sp.]PZR41800.1 MAG: cysteine hydrolase [Azospira oryzae]